MTIGDLGNMEKLSFGTGNISPDGKYFVSGLTREGDFKKFAGTDAMVVFKNSTIVDQVTEVVEIDVAESVTPALPVEVEWFQKNTAQVDILFPARPTLSSKTSKKGQVTNTYKSIHDNSAYMVIITELSSKTKPSKHQAIAEKVGENFVEKTGPITSKKSTYSYGGQSGVKYDFKKGNFDYQYRSICVYGQVFQIICINSEKDRKRMDKFFDSFKANALK